MYIKLTNGVPEVYTLAQLKKDNPNTSFQNPISDEVLAGFGVFSCTVVLQSYDPLTQKLVEGTIEQIEGQWTLNLVAENLALEKATANVVSRRSRLLSESDWVVVKSLEQGRPVDEAWAAYRQALRDITTQEGYPYAITWPQMP